MLAANRSVRSAIFKLATFFSVRSPAVLVRECNFTDVLQQWTCHSRNPLHLKLRAFRYSFVVDQVCESISHQQDFIVVVWKVLLASNCFVQR